MNMLIALAGVLFLSVASPGPNFVIVTSTAVASRRAGVMTGLGLAAASGTWAFAAIAGLSLLVAQAAWIALALRIAGAVYLIWLGLKMIATARHPLPAAAVHAQSGWQAAKKGYVVSMTNPKSIAFYGSIFALMVPAHAPVWFEATVVAIAIGMSCAWYCAMALLASHPVVRSVLVRRKAVLDSVAGTLLMGLGARLLVGR
ncbi:LysE family translocator [Paraburkholderia sp. J67]|uniref:LysE family translocator n=1 Tax=Paraburkholderia sp. J67 TaxID=2805435 RepID=UPI002ABDD046|nr:LysE family transporter [Paraburkholderia sp. J67]